MKKEYKHDHKAIKIQNYYNHRQYQIIIQLTHAFKVIRNITNNINDL